MDVVQQQPQHVPQPGQQEMMPPPTPTSSGPARKRKKNDSGEPASPAEPRRLRRSHEACARCRSKKIKVGIYFYMDESMWREREGCAGSPRHRTWSGKSRRATPSAFSSSASRSFIDALSGLAVAIHVCQTCYRTDRTSVGHLAFARRRRSRRRSVLNKLNAMRRMGLLYCDQRAAATLYALLNGLVVLQPPLISDERGRFRA